MNELISKKYCKARKDHECNACLWLREILYDLPKMTFGEYRSIVRAKWDNWKIKKGTTYGRVVGKYEGQIYTHGFREDIHLIMIKYKLYPDE